MIKKTAILIITATMFLISACDDSSVDIAVTNPISPSFLTAPSAYNDDDELLSEVGFAKFSEFSMSERPNQDYTTKALQKLGVFYKPGYIKPSFSSTVISINTGSNMSLRFRDATTAEFADFEWSWYILVENATLDFFGRAGDSLEYIKEHNGIDYAVVELADRNTGNRVGYDVGWAQHGQTFRGFLPASFTLDEVLAFCDAQPVSAWELDGNAMSVSAQGISELAIFEGPQEIVVEGETLYRQTPDGSRERVGYRWEIDGEAGRYQYVLEPGDYIFSASTDAFQRPSRPGQPGPELTVKHFTAGEVVSSVDYTEEVREQSSEEFSLMVTESPQEVEVLAGSAVDHFR